LKLPIPVEEVATSYKPEIRPMMFFSLVTKRGMVVNQDFKMTFHTTQKE